jgi:hypothetical protein
MESRGVRVEVLGGDEKQRPLEVSWPAKRPRGTRVATYSTVYLSWNEGKSRKLRSASWWLPPPMSEAYEAAMTWERREV